MAYCIFFTEIGINKIASATASEPLEITHIAVGDGGGGYPHIDETITSLVNEIYRSTISGVSATAPGQRQFTAYVDSSIGSTIIRERGLIDADGDLIAIAQSEPLHIPALGGPNIVDIQVSIVAAFSNTDHVRAVVDVQSYVRNARKVNTGSGLKGGGNLLQDLNLEVVFATSEQAKEGEAGDVVMSPESTKAAFNEFLQPQLTDHAIFSKENNSISLTGIVTKLDLEVGDVICISGSNEEANNKLFTVEHINSNSDVVVNYEHRDGRGSLSLENDESSVSIKRVEKWFKAAVGLGQAWVDVLADREAATDYTNATGRLIHVSAAQIDNKEAGTLYGLSYIDGLIVSEIGRLRGHEEYMGKLTHQLVVPAGSSYQVDPQANDEVCAWYELR